VRRPRSVVDGVLALGVLGALVALGLYYLRGRWRRTPRAVRRAALAIAVLALVLRLVTLGDQGQTWDEDENWSAGRNYVTNLLALDVSDDAWVWNLEHPPVMKYLMGVGAQLSDGFGPARVLSALVSAVTCGLALLVVARLYGRRAGLLAGVAAAATPHLVAHGQIVGHEAVSLLWWALALWLAVTTFDRTGAETETGTETETEAGTETETETETETVAARLPLRLVGLGVVLGLAIGSRFVSGLLAPLLGATLLIMSPRGQRLRTTLLGLAIMPATAIATLIAVWPRLWSSPLVHLGESWAKLSKPHGQEPWLGEMTNQPSPVYFIIYLVATAPLGILIGAALWKARTFVDLRRRVPGAWRAPLVLALLVLAPLGVMVSPVRQDGVRYVLPSVLALAMMAGVGVDGLATWLARRAPTRARGLAAAVVLALVAYLGVTLARIAPYHLDYYGEQVGGPSGVQARRWMETAWWGEGLDRAVAYVNAHAPDGAKVHRECVEPGHLTWFRGDLWPPMVTDARAADLIVTYAPRTRRCPVPKDARRVFSVDAQGAVLAEVWQRGAAP
jgi:4-amino-4-deoxy-L-arabinose transferase-like glycosyltransferase